jgi:hypothetical protein
LCPGLLVGLFAGSVAMAAVNAMNAHGLSYVSVRVRGWLASVALVWPCASLTGVVVVGEKQVCGIESWKKALQGSD